MITMVASAIHLVRLGRLRWVSQSASIGPAQRVASNQACSLGEARTKQAPANNTNGVVGSPGSKTPSAANPSDMNPAKMSTQRNNVGVGLWWFAGLGSAMVVLLLLHNRLDDLGASQT